MAGSTTTKCLDNTYGPGGVGDLCQKYQLYCFWSFMLTGLACDGMLKLSFLLNGPGYYL